MSAGEPTATQGRNTCDDRLPDQPGGVRRALDDETEAYRRQAETSEQIQRPLKLASSFAVKPDIAYGALIGPRWLPAPGGAPASLAVAVPHDGAVRRRLPNTVTNM
jgi:hypothetical protein